MGKRNEMKRIWVSLVALMLFSGCATPIPISETIPVYSGKPPATIAVAVADHRPFIVNNDKKEWFEGIRRGPFGIPLSQGRFLDSTTKPFAVYLATKLQEALEKAGAIATVVEIPKGTPVQLLIERVKKANTGAGLAVVMYQSRYDVRLINPEYGYNFELIVIGPTGKTVGQKTFKAPNELLRLSTKYNLFDMMAEIYKQKFDIFLNDPVIKNALTAAAAGS